MTFRKVNEELKKHHANVLSDIVLMLRIMSSLQRGFFEFKSIWESIPVTDISLDLLTEQIRLIESRLPSRSIKSEASWANVYIEKKFPVLLKYFTRSFKQSFFKGKTIKHGTVGNKIHTWMNNFICIKI